jgi:hypothetical protein
MKIDIIKKQQVEELKILCDSNGVNFDSMEMLIESERVKKLHKRNNYIQQTIDSEIEKTLKYED